MYSMSSNSARLNILKGLIMSTSPRISVPSKMTKSKLSILTYNGRRSYGEMFPFCSKENAASKDYAASSTTKRKKKANDSHQLEIPKL